MRPWASLPSICSSCPATSGHHADNELAGQAAQSRESLAVERTFGLLDVAAQITLRLTGIEF